MSGALTIVLPCRDDERVLTCVRSVDAPAEVLVVLNGSPASFTQAIVPELREQGVRVETLPDANLARALEFGIRAASNDLVLLMDSDCVFEPGAVAAFERAALDGPPTEAVWKGEIEFEAGGTRLGAVIARSRRQHTGRPLTAFKPPLVLSKAIAPAIGGYFFDERLPWKEDADFDCRVRRAGIEVRPVIGGRIRHAALSMREDLRSSYRYGVGAALADSLGIEVTTPSRALRETLEQEGLATAAYMALANVVRRVGYALTSRRGASGGR